MADLWAVLVGGAIGISGSLASALVAYGLESKKRLDERLSAVRKLMGRQAAMEVFAETGSVEDLKRKYLDMAAALDVELKKRPSLLDLTEGYLEELLADMASLRVEEERLKAEQARLRSELDDVRRQLGRDRPMESEDR